MKEIWLPIEGFEGIYEVSNLGNVRSLNYNHTGETKVLSQCEDNGGYLLVNLCKNGKRKTAKVHRLVAQTFIPNWFNYPDINHIDEDKHNNHVYNLEWCSESYNNNYGTRKQRVIEKVSKPVLQFTNTGKLVREWFSATEAGKNGFQQSCVVRCCRGESKTHKGYIWIYK